MNRTKVLETLHDLPLEFSIEEHMDKLLFIDKVEFGMKDAEEGKVISLDAAKIEWLRNGRNNSIWIC